VTYRVISQHELTFLFVARLCVCLPSVTFVRPTQAIEIFGDVSVPFRTSAIRWQPGKILRRLSQGNPSVGRGEKGGINPRG